MHGLDESGACCPPNRDCSSDLTRRAFVGTIGAAGAVTLISGCGSADNRARADQKPAPANSAAPAEEQIELSLTINKQKHNLKIDPRVTLLDLLRERLELPGTKKGCDHGQCGACTVIANGRTINSCLALAVMYPNAEITTVEGLANGFELHPVQAAFIKHDAFQCGYCTPGQIMSAVSLVGMRKQHSETEIREFMSGNICRCGAYPNIVAAIVEAEQGVPATQEKPA